MGMTRVVHVKSKEWRETPEDQRVYIGRAMRRQPYPMYLGSIWGNPFRIGQDSPNAEGVVALYRQFVTSDAYADRLRDLLPTLRGKTLGCWCKRNGDEMCHGDVLAELADAT